MTMIEMILIVMVEPLHTIRYFPTISYREDRVIKYQQISSMFFLLI
jgi:hypothetical protein